MRERGAVCREGAADPRRPRVSGSHQNGAGILRAYGLIRWPGTAGQNPAAPRQIPRRRTGLVCTMNVEIRDCLPPVRETRKPNVALPRGSVDTHVHVFEKHYRLSPGRGYNPPDSTLADLKRLHATLGIDRVVFTQPSVYGTDNSAILDAMAALNAETPGRARCVVAIGMDIDDEELARLDALGARGVRLNTDNKGGMPIGLSQIATLAGRIAPFGW